MAKEIKALLSQNLEGKKVTYLAFANKRMKQSRFDSIWDKLLPLATPVGGYQYSVWKDFKENNAQEILAMFTEQELLEVHIR